MAPGDGGGKKRCTPAQSNFQSSKPPPKDHQRGACRGGPSDNKRVDARHRRPAAAPRDLARASPALFAQKVLTHHKHLRKSAPPLRKPPLAQKALRALWPWLGHAGSTKFGRPRKTQAFFGAPELRPRAGVVRKAVGRGSAFKPSQSAARGLQPHAADKRQTIIYKNQIKFNLTI
jgi:hypothetical protein